MFEAGQTDQRQLQGHDLANLVRADSGVFPQGQGNVFCQRHRTPQCSTLVEYPEAALHPLTVF